MAEKLFQVGIKALIQNEKGLYLVLLADTTDHTSKTEPYWDIPGGRIQEGQDMLQA